MTGLVLIVPLILAAAGDARPTVLVVVGAHGAPDYRDPFRQQVDRWADAATRGEATLLLIGSEPADNVPDRRRLEQFLAELPKQSAEPLWLVLIGHGTFDGKQAKFNLRGPDVSAAELSEWLAPFDRPVAVINGASSSAPFINRLSSPGRVVVTATKSGYQLNYARFGDPMSEAIGNREADLDKDGQTSLLEAFLWASARVAEFYEAEDRLATETALLDDNGDALGTPAAWFRGVRAVRRPKNGTAPDGSRAHQLHLIKSEEEAKMPPEVRARRDELEQSIEALRAWKSEAADEDAYYARLEPLLLELARLYAAAETPADETR